jgi:hypothetical protein
MIVYAPANSLENQRIGDTIYLAWRDAALKPLA